LSGNNNIHNEAHNAGSNIMLFFFQLIKWCVALKNCQIPPNTYSNGSNLQYVAANKPRTGVLKVRFFLFFSPDQWERLNCFT